jgi:hypothetical protein
MWRAGVKTLPFGVEIFTPLIVALFGFIYAGSTALRGRRDRQAQRALWLAAHGAARVLGLRVEIGRRASLLRGALAGRPVIVELHPDNLRVRTWLAVAVPLSRPQHLPSWLDPALHGADLRGLTLYPDRLVLVRRGEPTPEAVVAAVRGAAEIAARVDRARPEANLR